MRKRRAINNLWLELLFLFIFLIRAFHIFRRRLLLVGKRLDMLPRNLSLFALLLLTSYRCLVINPLRLRQIICNTFLQNGLFIRRGQLLHILNFSRLRLSLFALLETSLVIIIRLLLAFFLRINSLHLAIKVIPHALLPFALKIFIETESFVFINAFQNPVNLLLEQILQFLDHEFIDGTPFHKISRQTLNSVSFVYNNALNSKVGHINLYIQFWFSFILQLRTDSFTVRLDWFGSHSLLGNAGS
jgi:hypothetical protein